MGSTSKAVMLRVGIIGFILAVCVGAIKVQQAGSNAESLPAATGGTSSFMPASAPALW